MRTIAIALFTLAGCIDEFRGSNVQIDFAPTMPIQASPFRAQGAAELPNNIHFKLYAFDDGVDDGGNPVGYLYELTSFEVHRLIDLDSPCYIDLGIHVPFPGLHVSQYAAHMAEVKGIPDIANPPASASEQDKIDVATAIQRQRNIAGIASEIGPKAITSVSPGAYGAVAADCNDTSAIPPPTCTDAASNQRRLDRCTAAWDADPGLFEGTDRIFTLPLNGSVQGFVTGVNPINQAPIGGAGFFLDEALDDFAGFAIYWQYDDANNDGEPDYPASVPAADRTEFGELFLYGRPEKHITRGVIRVPLRSILDPLIKAELAIFANIHEDDVHF